MLLSNVKASAFIQSWSNMFTISQRSSEKALIRPQHFQRANENHLAN